MTEQVVATAVDPPGVAVGEQRRDRLAGQRQHAGEVPAGEREDPRLERVEPGEQQVGAADGGDIVIGEGVEIAQPQGCADHAGRRRGDPVRREDRVVRAGRAGERVDELAPDTHGQVSPADLLTAEVEEVVAVQVGEVDQLVGHLVVVLQRVDEAARRHSRAEGEGEGEPQEGGVPRRQRVVVCRTVDEVIGQVGAGRPHRADVVDGEVELLEGEPTELADHARDELVRGDRERVTLGPRRPPGRPLLDAEEAVRVEPQRARPEDPDRVERVAHDEPGGCEGRVEPVERGLSLLEVVQVDPPPAHAVRTLDRGGGAPVGVLDAGVAEDDPLQRADDIARLGQRGLLRLVEVA